MKNSGVVKKQHRVIAEGWSHNRMGMFIREVEESALHTKELMSSQYLSVGESSS